MPNEQAIHPEAAVFVIRALEQSSQPMNVTKLAKVIPQSALKTKKDLPELLRRLVKAGQIRSHEGRSSVYWLPGLEDQVSARILEALSAGPLTQTDLRNKLRNSLTGWPQAKRDEMIALLIKEKLVYEVSPLTGKANLLSVRAELGLQGYIKLALQLAITKLKPLGFTSGQVMAAAQELIRQELAADKPPVQLERMIQLKLAAANGALVSLSDLRRSLVAEIPGKTAFDQAVLRLAKTGRVALRHHDYPGGLSQEERESLVLDEHGNYYTGAALRV